MATKVYADISKKANSWWVGRGVVMSFDVTIGVVYVLMLTGRMKGREGGFPLDNITFTTIHTEDK